MIEPTKADALSMMQPGKMSRKLAVSEWLNEFILASQM